MKILKILLLLPILSHASEGDAFSARLFTDYRDMGPFLNEEVNKRIMNALDKANKKKHSYYPDFAIKAMEDKFLRPVVGVFEFWSSHNRIFQGHYIKVGDSIYKDLNINENFPVQLGKFGKATFFNLNGTLVANSNGNE